MSVTGGAPTPHARVKLVGDGGPHAVLKKATTTTSAAIAMRRARRSTSDFMAARTSGGAEMAECRATDRSIAAAAIWHAARGRRSRSFAHSMFMNDVCHSFVAVYERASSTPRRRASSCAPLAQLKVETWRSAGRPADVFAGVLGGGGVARS